MYIKIINPATHGKNAYSNRGNARQATNYLEGEAKKQGEKAVFFNADRTDMTGDEAVHLLDSKRKGLRRDDAKFYSLVISPSAQELEHIGHDPQKLQAYTTRVMHEYAVNFVTKSGKSLSEKDLVWVATQHDERKHRGYDGAPSGQLKEGPQTHIHIMVSARDKEQKATLNPLGSVARFNRVMFMAKGNAAFEEAFGPVQQLGSQRSKGLGTRDSQSPDGPASGRRRTQTAEEIAESIRRRAAAKERRTGAASSWKKAASGTEVGDDVRDKQLFNQVNRVNKQLPPDRQLEHNKVLDVARKMDYSKSVYGRLGQLGMEAGKQNYHDLPYEFLRTGKNPKTAAQAIAEGQRRDKRLLDQVERLNQKLPEPQRLVSNQVLEIARGEDYSKAFYGRLNRIGRQAHTGKAVREPYEFLRTGKVQQPENGLKPPGAAPAVAPRNGARDGADSPPALKHYYRFGIRFARTYQPSAARTAASIGRNLSRALGTQGYTQDIRGDDERS